MEEPRRLTELEAVSFGLLADPRASTPLSAVSWPDAGAVALASGPEGGFTEAEVERLVSLGYGPAYLGPRILRAETAPLVLAAAAAAVRGL